MSEDVLDLLLPDSSAEERARVRRVITALRLLRDDARVREPRRVEPSWRRARGELERLELRARRRALDGLLHAYVSALRSPDSFLDLGTSPMDYGDAWRAALAEPALVRRLPPDPLEPAAAVAARLIHAGEESGAPEAWRALWQARVAHVTLPPADAERPWEALARAATASGAIPPFLARVVAGRVAARLDRLAPARALELGSAHPELVAFDLGLRTLVGWSALACGDFERARELLQRGAVVPGTRLPRPLADLRTAVPGWAPLLAGVEAGAGGAGQAAELDAAGSVIVAVFARRAGGAELVHLEAPRAQRGSAERLARELGAPQGARREHRIARDAPPLRGALAGARAAALVVVPIESEGRASGWLQLESEHHLLPSRARIEALARRFGAVLARPAPGGAIQCDGEELVDRPFEPHDPRAEFVARLEAELSPPAGVRGWWLEPDERGADRVRARVAGDRARPAAISAAAAAARSARTELRAARWAGGDAHGRALPLLDVAGRRALGVLLLECEREDRLEPLVESARRALALSLARWWSATFRASERARSGDDVAWDPGARFLAGIEPAVQSAAHSRAAAWLVGSPGSGRRTLARWLHLRGPRSSFEVVEGPRARASGGTRIVEVEDLARDAQLELARRLSSGGPERVVLLSRATPQALREGGLLAPELERCADPLPIEVPRLRERRDEIPALAETLASNVARREALARARFRDDALAALWRQDWRGNVTELAALAAQLARAHAGREVGVEDVRAAFRSRRLEFRARLPSLRPKALDLELALASTRHRAGSENRARAARYLGWDPETLERRLGSLRRGER